MKRKNFFAVFSAVSVCFFVAPQVFAEAGGNALENRRTELKQTAERYVAVARDGASRSRENFSMGLATELDVMRAETAALVAEQKALLRLCSVGIFPENFLETEKKLSAEIRKNFEKLRAALESLQKAGTLGAGESKTALQELARERAEFELENAWLSVLTLEKNSVPARGKIAESDRACAERRDALWTQIVELRKAQAENAVKRRAAGRETLDGCWSAEIEFAKARLAQNRNRQILGENEETVGALRAEEQELLKKIREIYAKRISAKAPRTGRGESDALKIEALEFELSETR